MLKNNLNILTIPTVKPILRVKKIAGLTLLKKAKTNSFLPSEVSYISVNKKPMLITSKIKTPKIVGDIRHYPPANKEWKNSIYAFNKNSIRSTPALDKVASRTIKSYFNLTNNKKLARSYRMRNLIRRRTSKRIYTSKPEIKQTSSKVNITVYIYNREGQFLLRKLYFYKKNMNINKDIYLHKIWLRKNLLAFRKTFKGKNSVRLLKKNKKLITRRKNKNKTYMHNSLITRYIRKNRKDLAKRTKVPFRKKLFRLNPLLTKNMLKSLKKRNLIRSLKKREKKIRFALATRDIDKKNLLIFSKVKTFENYLIKKRSKKINFKLRRYNSVVKIKKKLNKFFF